METSDDEITRSFRKVRELLQQELLFIPFVISFFVYATVKKKEMMEDANKAVGCKVGDSIPPGPAKAWRQ